MSKSLESNLYCVHSFSVATYFYPFGLVHLLFMNIVSSASLSLLSPDLSKSSNCYRSPQRDTWSDFPEICTPACQDCGSQHSSRPRYSGYFPVTPNRHILYCRPSRLFSYLTRGGAQLEVTFFGLFDNAYEVWSWRPSFSVCTLDYTPRDPSSRVTHCISRAIFSLFSFYISGDGVYESVKVNSWIDLAVCEFRSIACQFAP